jgi:hypothetical protein
MTRAAFAGLAAALLAVSVDTAPRAQNPAWELSVESIPSPAAAESAQPQLSASSRGVVLSWVERSAKLATLKFAERTRTGWTKPQAVASGSDWFVNWADVPSVVRLRDGTLAAHWLQKSGPGTYAYDVRLSHSKDARTWSPSIVPHRDGTQTEHGFASLFDAPGGQLGLVWLDGRAMKADHSGGHESSGDMSLRFLSYGADWKPGTDTPLDLRVCECCPTAVAMTADGPLVAYRDRGAGEVRDIYVTRLENGKWSAPSVVHSDNWRVPACPVNGPALSARGREVAIAWFTAKDDQPKSYAAFSSDAGRTFGSPIRLDDQASLGRVQVQLLADGSAAVAYVEFASQKASFRLRRVERTGARSAPVTVAGIAGSRASGLPRMALHGNELVFAWVDREGGSQVRTARAVLK